MDKQYKILLVEDEPELAQMFAAALKKAGFALDQAVDGLSAIKKIREMTPDLVLLDLVIPEVDGYAVLEKTKKYKPTKDIMVYVWSNLTQQHEIDKAKNLGADGYLIKSDYTPTKLVERVKEILKQN